MLTSSELMAIAGVARAEGVGSLGPRRSRACPKEASMSHHAFSRGEGRGEDRLAESTQLAPLIGWLAYPVGLLFGTRQQSAARFGRG